MQTADGPRGIGGWLILPTIGLLIFPGFILFDLVFQQWPVFGEGMWPMLTMPGAPLYHPLWAPLIVGGIGYDLAILAFDVALLFLLFGKSARFPIAFVVFCLVNAVFLVVTGALVWQIPIVAERGSEALVREIAPPVVVAAIWVPYMLVSKRVRNTFRAAPGKSE
jgi:hypothetical protein